MPSLDREQRGIINEINRAAQTIPKGLRRKFKIAALETGLVESGLHNLNYGTGDSKGWRQERTSIYGPSATNVRASVGRFRNEFLTQYKPGETAGQVAADVQRPAKQYRGRYQQAYGQAVQLLGQYGGVTPGGAGATPGAYTQQTYNTPGVDNSATRQQLKLDYLANRGKPGALLQLLAGLRAAKDVPGTSTTVSVPSIPQTYGKQAGSDAVALMKQAAETIDRAHVPYQWGGGHAGRQNRFGKVTPLDCSGAVSRVLGIDPRVSGQFESWGKPGEGKRVTIYANGTHVLMKIDGRLFGTSDSNPGGGAGWIPQSNFPKGYFKNFVARHPPSL